MTPETLEGALAELAFAYENVPFFGKHLDAAGLRPSDLRTQEDWRRVPPTVKADYRRNFPAGILAKGRTLKDPGLYRSQSSGTEGERLVTVASTVLLTQRWMSCLGINPRFSFLLKTRALRTVRLAAPNCSDVECANPNAGMADRMLADRTLVLPVHHDLMATPERMLDQAAAELKEYAPQLLYVDPNHFTFLVRHMRGKGLAIPAVGGVACTYALLTQVARRDIAAQLSPETPICEVVSMTEFGWVGMECAHGTMHLNAKSYFAELLAGDGPAAPGELGELTITSLGDRVSPHIRYRTGDIYRRLDLQCPCGSRFPAVRVEGRSTHLPRRGGKVVVTARELDGIVGAPPWLDVYQLEQAGEDDFVFRFIPNSKLQEGDAEPLAERIRGVLGEGAGLRVERVGYIPAERSGKFLTCRVAR